MQRARETGLKFNIEKCQIRCESIPFFGHVVGADGLRPDQKKVEAIRSMDPSNNVADLRTFLGMVQFLSRFVPDLATLAADLVNLFGVLSTISRWIGSRMQSPLQSPCNTSIAQSLLQSKWMRRSAVLEPSSSRTKVQ